MNEKTISVIGGDLRQLICAGELCKNGYTARVFGIDIYHGFADNSTVCDSLEQALSGASAVLLPIPCSTDGVNIRTPFFKGEIKFSDICAHLPAGAHILGGMIPERFCEFCDKKGIKYTDYYKNEALTVSNTVPTSEGALEIAMRELPITINGMKCVVTGYGNVGQTMSKVLVSLGAECTVAARRQEALARAKINGCKTTDFKKLHMAVRDADCVFNTVPSCVIDKTVLENMKCGALIIDLASVPGGVDRQTADSLGIKTVLALSLPGKCSPVSAGKLLGQTVMNILTEVI